MGKPPFPFSSFSNSFPINLLFQWEDNKLATISDIKCSNESLTANRAVTIAMKNVQESKAKGFEEAKGSCVAKNLLQRQQPQPHSCEGEEVLLCILMKSQGLNLLFKTLASGLDHKKTRV